jgi:hypothetical protein
MFRTIWLILLMCFVVVVLARWLNTGSYNLLELLLATGLFVCLIISRRRAMGETSGN